MMRVLVIMSVTPHPQLKQHVPLVPTKHPLVNHLVMMQMQDTMSNL
jgi:hypothetical protein